MTRATAVKLIVFIFLALIVCLPEFFPSDTDMQIQFFCLPFDPCDTASGWGPKDDGQDCEDIPLAFQNESGAKPLCKEPKNTTSQDELMKNWFVCETPTDLQSLHSSLSDVDVKVVLSLQTTNLSQQNVTTYGHVNRSGLHAGSFQNVALVRCCGPPGADEARAPSPSLPRLYPPPQPIRSSRPSPPRSAQPRPGPWSEQIDSASNLMRTLPRSQCFLRYLATAVPRTPAKKGRWWCITATVWLVLVLIVVVVVLVSAAVQVSPSLSSCHKQGTSVPFTVSRPRRFSKQRTKSLRDLPDVVHSEDEVLFVEVSADEILSMEKTLVPHARGLFPINETSVDGEEEEEESDSTVAKAGTCGNLEKGCKESLDMGQTPAHTQHDSLIHLHRRCHSFSDKDGGI